MVGHSGKRGNLAPVDTSGAVRRIEIEGDRQLSREERDWKLLMRRERSGAYWFAATKWGIAGLVIGMVLGGAGMYYASLATLDLAQDAVTKGAIVERLRQEHDQTPVAPPTKAP
jgi:hypothetical protein